LNVRTTRAFTAQSRFTLFDVESEPFFGRRVAPVSFQAGQRPVSVTEPRLPKQSRHAFAIEPRR